jgi:hypothetical protein
VRRATANGGHTLAVAMTSDGVVAAPTSHAIDHTRIGRGLCGWWPDHVPRWRRRDLVGVKAEAQSLETVTKPLTAVES